MNVCLAEECAELVSRGEKSSWAAKVTDPANDER